MFMYVVLLCLVLASNYETRQATAGFSPKTASQNSMQIYSLLRENSITHQSVYQPSKGRPISSIQASVITTSNERLIKQFCLLHIPNSMNTINITNIYDFLLRYDNNTDDHIRINLCGELFQECARKEGYAVCFHKDKEEFAVGKFPPTVSLEESKIVLSHTGDRCNRTHMFVARIELQCDPYDRENFYVMDDVYDPTTCEFTVVMNTAMACRFIRHYSCALQHQTKNYSLHRLINAKNDYVIHINRTLSVVLNVCRSLVFWEQRVNCGPDSAICLIDQSSYNKTKYTNLGDIMDHAGITYAADGVIKVTYENGSVCDSDRTKRMRSTISFICDMDAKEGYAEYAGGLKSCDLLFVWKTAAACSEEALLNSSLANRGICRVTDPINGQIYDFLDLHKDNMHTWNEKHDDFQFSVCQPTSSQCVSDTGVCKTYNDTNLKESGGMANWNLTWSPRIGLYLNYTGGDKCANGQPRYTVIEIKCDDGHFVNVFEDQCSTTILFMTKTACPQICSPFRHTKFDSLMNSTIGYKIEHDDAQYSFSVCGSINPLEHLNCNHGGAGICKLTQTHGETSTETDLGYPKPIPLVIGEGITALNYVNGSICGNRKISSQISLTCDVNATKSFPEFISYNDCHYHFAWRSRQSCGVVDCKLNTDCSIENDLGHHWNFTFLHETLVHSVLSNKSNITYEISICGKSNAVGDSDISTTKRNFGKLVKVSTDYVKNITLKFYFDYGTLCVNGSHARSILYLICDETHNPDEPVLIWEEECSVAFEWRTRHVCSPGRTLPHSPESGWRAYIIFVILLSELLAVAVAIILMYSPRIRVSIANWMRDTSNRFILYTRIGNNR